MASDDDWTPHRSHSQSKCPKTSTKHDLTRGKVKPKQEWTQEEKRAVLSQLDHLVREERVPQKKECMECKEKSAGVLDKRDWRGIKYFIKNQITKRKRIKRKY